MLVSPYVPTNSPVLRQVAKVIPTEHITSKPIQEIIDLMVNTGKKEPNMAGLAAPQVGFSFRIIIVSDKAFATDRPEPGKTKENSFRVFVNPRITYASHEKENDTEGCFSVPGDVGVVPRVKSITVSAYDRNGKKVNLELTGFAARVFQHEIDHINGLIYPDRIFRFQPDSIGFHFLNDSRDSSEYKQERLKEYKEAIEAWKAKHGSADGFTWPYTISKRGWGWEHDMVQSAPDWKNDPLPSL
jgi:peptide deformylase